MSRIYPLCLIVFLSGCVHTARTPLLHFERSPVWIAPVEWKDAPGVVDEQYGGGTLMYFGLDGYFALGECTLLRWRGEIGVSQGDGLNRYVGTWKLAGVNNIAVKYNLDTPTKLQRAPRMLGPVINETFTVSAVGSEIQIVRRGVQFKASNVLANNSTALLFGR